MAAAQAPDRRNYPTKAAIVRAVEAAKLCGLDVAGFEVSPAGTIKVVEARAIPAKPESEFDKWDRAGKL